MTAKNSVTYFLHHLMKQFQNFSVQPSQGEIFANIQVEFSKSFFISCVSQFQEYFVKLMVVFMQNCTCFQGLPSESKSALLRKNISECSILLASMSFDRSLQQFQ